MLGIPERFRVGFGTEVIGAAVDVAPQGPVAPSQYTTLEMQPESKKHAQNAQTARDTTRTRMRAEYAALSASVIERPRGG
jgi:hypothetical protein